MPYPNVEEMLADKRFYDRPWEEPVNSNYLNLNGILWKFHFVSCPYDCPKGFYLEDYDTSGWDSIPVPSNWKMQEYDRPVYCNVEYPHENAPPFLRPRPGFNDGGKNYGINSVGSYIRTFHLSESWKEDRTFIHFCGIYSAAWSI